MHQSGGLLFGTGQGFFVKSRPTLTNLLRAAGVFSHFVVISSINNNPKFVSSLCPRQTAFLYSTLQGVRTSQTNLASRRYLGNREANPGLMPIPSAVGAVRTTRISSRDSSSEVALIPASVMWTLPAFNRLQVLP